MSTSTTASSSPKADPESGDLIIHVTEQIHGHSGVELGGIGILESGDKDGKEEKLLKQNTQSAISPDGPYRRLGSDELSMALSKLSNNLELRLAANENSRSPAYKYGDPGAFGLGGFALTTFALSVCNAGQLSSGVSEVVLPLAMWYGGFTQLFAGLWEVQTGFTFAATAYCSYGAFWLSYATFAKFVVPDFATALAAGTIDENDINHASGLFLLSWTFFTLFMTIAAWRVNRAVFLIFALLLPTFILLTAGAYANNSDATKAGGWIGILCAFSAWYVMAAKVINATNKKVVLPLGEVD